MRRGPDSPDLMPDLRWERDYWAQGYVHVAGLDEAGRGAWAGPVVAAAVILPADDPHLAEHLDGVRDSKQLTPARREVLYQVIHRVAWAVGVGVVPPARIDEIGIVPATRQAMREALAQLTPPPQALLIDALSLPRVSLPQRSLVKGDAFCLSIAAASIIAKVYRDRLMVELDQQYPGYGFARHKGYGTPQHRAALLALGASPVHRHSYAPVRRLRFGQ